MYSDQQLRDMIKNGAMTSAIWRNVSSDQRERVRDESQLCAELRGLEGYRVEATHYGERIRFQVGMSTGWKPCHLRLHNVRSIGGDAITRGSLHDVRMVRRVR